MLIYVYFWQKDKTLFLRMKRKHQTFPPYHRNLSEAAALWKIKLHSEINMFLEFLLPMLAMRFWIRQALKTKLTLSSVRFLQWQYKVGFLRKLGKGYWFQWFTLPRKRKTNLDHWFKSIPSFCNLLFTEQAYILIGCYNNVFLFVSLCTHASTLRSLNQMLKAQKFPAPGASNHWAEQCFSRRWKIKDDPAQTEHV